MRGGEAIIAAGAAGVGQAVERFGFRNAERAAPQIIGRPADAEQLIMRAGQRAQEVQRAAAADIEEFAAEQAAAETTEITPLLAETGAAAAETGGLAAAATGAAEALGGAAVVALAPEVAICDPSSSGPGAGDPGTGHGRCGWSLPGRKVHAGRRWWRRRGFQAPAASSKTCEH